MRQYVTPKNRARTQPEETVVFFGRNPLSKSLFELQFVIFDPFESPVPHAAAQLNFCSLHSCSEFKKLFQRFREDAAEESFV